MSLSEETRLIDAKPLPVAKGKRAQLAKCPKAAKGFSTMGMVYAFRLLELARRFRGSFCERMENCWCAGAVLTV